MGLSESRKKTLAAVAAGACTLLAVGMLVYQFTGYDPGADSRTRTMIDAATGEVFLEYRVSDGTRAPYKHPKTGEHTLYPAESCFWTRDGKAKLEPTYVLVNEYVGKSGPTLCPDCGRKVVPRNPMPPAELIIAASKAAE